MSDVAQILGLAGPSGGASGPAGPSLASELEQLKPAGAPAALARSRSAQSKPKKLTGMQREVLELLESSHRASHSLYQGLSKPTLRQKWSERRHTPATKWLRKPFRNPAREKLAGEAGEEGGLVLAHWVKAHVEPPPYVFARFNVACDVTAYTEDEYARAVEGHEDQHMKWTKEETDTLMKLCARFDLRWVVVADRYNTHPIAKGALRSVEDIKYRYYEVTRLLGEFRDKEKHKPTGNASAAEGIKQEPGAEETKSETSTPAGVKVESTTQTPGIPSSDKYYRFNVAYEKQRKRQLELAFSRSIEEENEIRKLNDELRSVEQQLKKAAVKVDPKKKKELADVPYEIKRTMPTGAFLRSATLALPPAQPKQQALSAKMLKKMQLLLDEVGVPARPMPTKPVCEMFDRLRQDAVGLLSLRKHLAAKQTEMQLLRERYQTLTGMEYTPVTSKLQRSVRRGDTATAGAIAGAGAGAANSATPAAKGKSLKHSEKAPRSSSKRQRSGSSGLPAKRNKKVLH